VTAIVGIWVPIIAVGVWVVSVSVIVWVPYAAGVIVSIGPIGLSLIIVVGEDISLPAMHARRAGEIVLGSEFAAIITDLRIPDLISCITRLRPRG
jgi:hypothetical protein